MARAGKAKFLTSSYMDSDFNINPGTSACCYGQKWQHTSEYSELDETVLPIECGDDGDGRWVQPGWREAGRRWLDNNATSYSAQRTHIIHMLNILLMICSAVLPTLMSCSRSHIFTSSHSNPFGVAGPYRVRSSSVNNLMALSQDVVNNSMSDRPGPPFASRS